MVIHFTFLLLCHVNTLCNYPSNHAPIWATREILGIAWEDMGKQLILLLNYFRENVHKFIEVGRCAVNCAVAQLRRRRT